MGLIASFMGLSGPLKIAIYAGVAFLAISAAVGWLRWDAIQDERTRAAAEANATIVEDMKDKNEIEEEIDNADGHYLRDILGIPQ